MFLPKRFTERYENRTLDEIVELSEGSDLVGISLMTNFFNNAVQITKKLKNSTNIPVLWGGIHPTIRPEESLDYADMVCVGEGEEAIAELLTRIEERRYFYDVHGIWFKSKNNIITNPIRPLTSLDHIPFPDYDFRNHFILNKNHIQKLDIKLLREYMEDIYMTMPTRGCPFGCTYCCNNALNKLYPNQKPVRKRSIDNIIEELAEIKSSLPFINRIKFDDDAFFTLSLEEIKEFCEKYRRVGLPLSITGATPLTLSREKLSLLINAGLNFIRIGIQTGSERTKKLYNRRYTNQQVERAAKIIGEFKHKIEIPQYDIILDNPWETDEDLIETLIFLSKVPVPYRLCLFSLNFYPGTELYKKAKKEGIITNDFQDVYIKHYHSCGGTYLNRLFFLLSLYASNGIGISTTIMLLLTNKKIMRFNLHWLLYAVLKAVIVPLTFSNRIRYLYQKGLVYIRQGDWYAIQRYINRYLAKR
jgi:radical SAM superfamily enzyme YgiQ (UPF0313 family)